MRVVAWALGCLVGLVVLLVVGWFAYGLYVENVVSRSPATVPITGTGQGAVELGRYEGGDQVLPLRGDSSGATPPEAPPAPSDRAPEARLAVRPSASPLAPAQPAKPAPPTPEVASSVAARTPQPTAADPGATTASTTPPVEPTVSMASLSPMPDAASGRPVLPPTRLLITRIGVDAPVVLADNDDPPSFRAVGWFMGSGNPGFRGNVVLFGQSTGELATFSRLGELGPGDGVTLEAMEQTYRYVVGGSRVVGAEATEWLLPSRDFRLTLITSAGTFDPVARGYSQRLVVVAQLVGE